MQFITTDQRIAVENFEVGLIYTVTFSNGDSFTGSCMGIGVDFVAFQRTAPEYIFCLTMTTAADVASIEPLSVDIGKILTYTGSVPVSIKTDGTPLLDYLITGSTVQNGTPTPENPIMPEGCGELDSGQYKIPISSAGQTTPVYLGEVQTTRKIRELVFDGTENVDLNAVDKNRLIIQAFYTLPRSGTTTATNIICTHLVTLGSGSATSLQQGIAMRYNGTDILFGVPFALVGATVEESNATIRTKVKSYLAAQYAAGTPVTVWYVLATEETAVVNEPLMRIGDYADTLSFIQSGIKIPTTDGLDIFDIDTTVKPSEVYLKYFSPIF